MNIHIYIYITSSKQALNDEDDGNNHLFKSGHSMNIYLFFLLSTDTEHFTFLFNEFKLN